MAQRPTILVEWDLRFKYYAAGIVRTIRFLGWRLLGLVPSKVNRRVLVDSHPFPDVPGHGRVVQYQGRTIVEPKYGWAIAAPASLLRDSLTHGDSIHTWKGREWIGLPPLTGLARRRPLEHVGCAISLMSPWPENYYHFVFDVLPKLCVLDDNGLLDPSQHYLVADVLFESRFFKSAIRHGRLASLEFRAVSTPLRTDDLVVPDTTPVDADVAASMRSLLGVADMMPVAEHSKIFLTRGEHRGRTLRSMGALRAEWEQLGYRTVDVDGLTFSEQVSMFRGASHIAAIHGACLANLVWCEPGAVVVTELVPTVDSGEFDCFQRLCADLAIPLYRVFGNDTKYAHKRASFDVDRDALRVALTAAEGARV